MDHHIRHFLKVDRARSARERVRRDGARGAVAATIYRGILFLCGLVLCGLFLCVLRMTPALAQQTGLPRPPKPDPASLGQVPLARNELPQLTYSTWVKLCERNPTLGKDMCFTGKEVRTQGGQSVAVAAFIEAEGDPKPLLRLTLQFPVQLQYGARVIIDQLPPLTAPFFTCLGSGCLVDYAVTPEMVGALKNGRVLNIQAVNLTDNPVSFALPLEGFAKAMEGPPTDPRQLDTQNRLVQRR